jgi:hypothetical protein
MAEGEERIKAFLQLFQCASDKKYLLKNKPCSYESITPAARQLNDSIKEETGIDLFLIKDYETIAKYEDILSNLFSRYTYSSLFVRDISDDVEFLNKSQIISAGCLYDSKIMISSSCVTFLKHYKREIRIDAKYLTRIAHKPNFVSRFTGLSSPIFLTTTKITVMGREKILLLLMRPVIAELQRDAKMEVMQLDMKSVFDKMHIAVFLLFSFKKLKKYFSNPAALFLKGLDYYGMDIELKNMIKRLHLNVCFHTMIEDPTKYLKKAIKYRKRETDVIIPSTFRLSDIAFCYEFVCAINMYSVLQAFLQD